MVLVALFSRHVDAELVLLSWHRTVAVEKKGWEHRESAQHPSNARNIQAHRDPYLVDHTEWRTEKQYVNGEEQTVRRQVTRQEMKIRKVYTYEVHVWRFSREILSSGQGQSGVRWPEFALADGEREGLRTESYHASFSAPSGRAGSCRKYTLELQETVWRSLVVGAKYRLVVGRSGGVKYLEPVAIHDDAEPRTAR